jgi:hypothetical protein
VAIDVTRMRSRGAWSRARRPGTPSPGLVSPSQDPQASGPGAEVLGSLSRGILGTRARRSRWLGGFGVFR